MAMLRLNPHPRLRRECGTRKFNGVRLGDVEGWATLYDVVCSFLRVDLVASTIKARKKGADNVI